MSPLQSFGDQIWLCDGPGIRMMTIPFSTRMTVVLLDDDDLWVHSAVALSPEISAAIDALGTVRYIVAPNKLHSVGIQSWKHHYPSAEVWVSPRFTQRHPDIAIDAVIGESASEPWKEEIESLHFGGSWFLDEVVFYHRRSRTLILTDLIQRHDPAQESIFWRAVKRFVGVLGPQGGTARDLRLTFRSAEAARESALAILGWDFDRAVISHGTCLISDAHRYVERAFGWALDAN